jgi:two-component system sensor histidine kinase AtoS
MSGLSRFSLINRGRKRSIEWSEFEAVLDLIPKATLLIDQITEKVLCANAKAAELSGYSRSELGELELTTLVPTWHEETQLQNIQEEPESLTIEDFFEWGNQEYDSRHSIKNLVKKNGEQALMRIQIEEVNASQDRALVTFESEKSRLLQQKKSKQRLEFWSHLIALGNATQQTDLKHALQSALEASQALTGAGILAVYQAGDNEPGLVRCADWGETGCLPNRLPPQDLTQLNQPYLWEPAGRSLSPIHRVGRNEGFSYIASTPLGEPGASIGLLIAADRSGEPSEEVLLTIQTAAANITTILQQQAMITSIQDRLRSLLFQLAISESLQEAVHEGLLVLSPELVTLKMNRSAEMMLGYASNEVRNQPVENILIGTETLIPALTDAQQGNATYNLGNVRLFRRNGETFLAHVSTIPIAKRGAIQGIMVLFNDLSEEEQIREHTQQLEQRALLGEVTAIFAHEVRNPINNISTGLQVMAMSLPDDDPNQEAIARLQTDCDRLEELMKSVLSFSRPTDYQMASLDAGMLVKRLVERLHPRMARVNVKHHLQIEPNCPQVKGNLRALEQVFTNLINNAVQAMSETGGNLAIKVQPHHKRITAEKPDPAPRGSHPDEQESASARPSVEISVADTGPGIPKDVQERIFQPFFTTNRNGTGLGLAITKRIVTAHKGNIYVTSFPGGTVFHVLLPVADDQAIDEIE